MEYYPEKSEAQCYETLNNLYLSAKDNTIALAEDGNAILASVLSAQHVSSQTQTMALWHKMETLEKKIDQLIYKGGGGFSNSRFSDN